MILTNCIPVGVVALLSYFVKGILASEEIVGSIYSITDILQSKNEAASYYNIIYLNSVFIFTL